MEFKPSKTVFIVQMIFGVLMLCPTFGLWIFVMIPQILSYLNQSLHVNEGGLIMRTGILNVTTQDIKYSKINSITVRKSLLGRFLNYGTLVIFTGNDLGGIAFKNLDEPYKVKSILDNKIAG